MIFRLLILLSLTLTMAMGHAQDTEVDNLPIIEHSPLSKRQSQIIYDKAKVFPTNTQLSIAMITDGRISFYGVKRVNDTLETIENSKSVFEIGSISKVFTATLLADFVINDIVLLEDNIDDYLDIQLKDNQKIIFKELANHTSGLPSLPFNLTTSMPDPNNPYAKYHQPQLEEYLTKQLDLSKKVDNNYAYSNLGAGLLGYTLAQIANSSYEDLLQSQIFDNYNMTSSTTNRELVQDQLVGGLNYEGKPAPNWDLGVLAGAGAILSSVEDLSKFAMAQLDPKNESLALTRTKTTTVNENMSVGLGWHIIKNEPDNNWIWHNGGTGGYTSSMAIDTNRKNAVIILSNVSAYNPNMGNVDKLCFELLTSLNAE